MDSEYRNGDRLPVEIMARRDDWQRGISLYARQVIVGESESIAAPMQFIEHNEAEASAPFIRLSIHTAQQLMDELWQCGIRPTEGTGSAGSLKATQDHLSDMRKIVFKRLNMEGQ